TVRDVDPDRASTTKPHPYAGASVDQRAIANVVALPRVRGGDEHSPANARDPDQRRSRLPFAGGVRELPAERLADDDAVNERRVRSEQRRCRLPRIGAGPEVVRRPSRDDRAVHDGDEGRVSWVRGGAPADARPRRRETVLIGP